MRCCTGMVAKSFVGVKRNCVRPCRGNVTIGVATAIRCIVQPEGDAMLTERLDAAGPKLHGKGSWRSSRIRCSRNGLLSSSYPRCCWLCADRRAYLEGSRRPSSTLMRMFWQTEVILHIAVSNLVLSKKYAKGQALLEDTLESWSESQASFIWFLCVSISYQKLLCASQEAVQAKEVVSDLTGPRLGELVLLRPPIG